MRFHLPLATRLIALLAPAVSLAGDWPHWLGPERDGSWLEAGIIQAFPESGPEVLWRAEVAHGYSGPAVADGRVYVSDYLIRDGEVVNNPGKAIALKGTERTRCFDFESGKLLWEHAEERDYELSYPGGPRATPTVADGKVYVLGGMGHLDCLDATTGKPAWEVDLPAKFGAEFPIWGYSAHPLVHGDLVITMAGGAGSACVALDKNTGETRWTALDSPEPGYCPPSLIRHGGREQLIIWTPSELASLKPETGELFWTQPLKPNFNMSVAAPRKTGNLLFASGIGRVAALYQLDEEKPAASVVWKGRPKTAVYCSNSTPVAVGETLFGVDIDTSQLMAVDLANEGERLWGTTAPVTGKEGDRGARHGTAFLTRHKGSGLFYLFNELGELIIARLTPEAYEAIDTAKLLEPTNEAFGRPVVWSPPAFAGQSILVRNDKELVRVNLAAD